mgnify:CR=1 FL=1
MGNNSSRAEYEDISTDTKVVHLLNFARVGNLPMCKYFESAEPDIWSRNVQEVGYISATHGYFDCMQFALDTGAYVDRTMFVNTLKCCNVKCLKFIINKYGLQFLHGHDAEICAKLGLLENLKCLHDSGWVFDVDELRAARFYGHEKCVEFIESVIFK